MYSKDKKNRITLRLTENDLKFCVNQSKNLKWSVSRYIRYLIRAECALIDFGVEYKEHINDK